MKQQEQAVWQRVMAAKENVQENSLKTHAMQSMEAIREYTALQRKNNGRLHQLASELYKQEQQVLQGLKGLQQLQTGTPMQLPKLPGYSDPDRRCMVRRYHSTRKAATEFMIRSAESEWGCVFLAMAKIQENQCFLLAQVLGMM